MGEQASLGGTARNPARDQEFVRLLSRNEMRIHAYLMTLVPHWADAEELLQETSLVLWEKFHEFEPGSDFVRWACSIAHYKVLNFRRKHQRDRLVFSENFIDLVAAKRLERGEALDQRREPLAHCLETLRPSDRQIIERCYGDDKSIRLAAEELGRPVNTLYKALNRIRKSLLLCVQQKQGGEGSIDVG